MKAVGPVSLLAALAFPWSVLPQDDTPAEVEAIVETIKQVKEEALSAAPSPRRMRPALPPIQIPPPGPPAGGASEAVIDYKPSRDRD